jgi:hypothetical protein
MLNHNSYGSSANLEVQIADNYYKSSSTLNSYTGTFKYGPQSLVQMDSYIYVGGAVGNTASNRFCPIVAKFDKYLNQYWAW